MVDIMPTLLVSTLNASGPNSSVEGQILEELL